MRHLFIILSHEIRMLVVSASSYIAAVLFLALMGFMFVALLENYSKAPMEIPPPTVFFHLFWLPVLFMVPLLTMKSISEERRLGTMETLLTTPVSTTEVVIGKYLAAYLLYILLWAATGAFFYVLQLFVSDTRLMDPAPLFGGYLFIAASGLFFIALGIFASALSKNQAVAGILCFVFLFAVIFGVRFAGSLEFLNIGEMNILKDALDYGSVFRHIEDFTHGIVDTRQLLYYVSGAVLALILSILSIEIKIIHS